MPTLYYGRCLFSIEQIGLNLYICACKNVATKLTKFHNFLLKTVEVIKKNINLYIILARSIFFFLCYKRTRRSTHIPLAPYYTPPPTPPGELYDSLLLDVDSKDVSVGMSCPPESFVEPSFLQVMADCLRPDGEWPPMLSLL